MKQEIMKNKLQRNRILSRFFAALLCATLISITTYATDYGDVSVKVETVTDGISGSGYDEYRATIINRSKTQPRRITLVLSVTGAVGHVVRRIVEVAPSSTASISLLKPQGFYAPDAAVLIDGEQQDEPAEIDESRTNAWTSRSENAHFLLISRNVDRSGLMNHTAVIEGFKNAKSENDVAHLAYPSPMQEWSTNWLGYSSFDGVIVTSDELRAAPESVRSTLLRYVECGGSMVVIGEWEIPKQWEARREAISDVKESKESPGKLVAVEKSNWQTFFVGFGELIVTGAVDPKAITPAEWAFIKNGWQNSRPENRTYYDIADINKDFSVVERIGIPVRGLFTLMLAFVIIIGPINLIWLSRRRKKIWMLWTVPAIALVTCLAVAGFALFGEGVSATSRTEAFTILDETSHRATTIGWMAFYSPITPGDGLRFSYDTELMPQWPEMWKYRGGGGVRTIDWSGDQHLASDWITARVPAFFKFRKSETRRERLTIRQSVSGAITVVNGLGADIRHLWVADRSGRIHLATKIGAGAQADLRPINFQAAGDGSGLRDLFGDDDWLAMMRGVEQNPARSLMPGCYLAALDSNPFVEGGLSNVKTSISRSLVYGISAEGER
jgi:hypothetical protein